MKTQTIINIVFAVAFVGYVVWQRNPTFDTITCNAMRGGALARMGKQGSMRDPARMEG